MKKYSLPTFTAVVICLVVSDVRAQGPINTGTGFGFQVSQFQKDFGFGVHVTSPYFVYDRIAVRLRGNLVFNESVQNSVVSWVPYTHLSLGIVGVGGMVGDYIRCYGEGGFVGLLPADEFSTEQFVFGGYGLFGFEFFMGSNRNYFIEIGAIGTGATADKVATQPIYSNGLLINVGVRFIGR